MPVYLRLPESSPYTYGIAAAPIYNPWVGYTFGFAMGLATAAWLEPYWGGAWYSPGYWGGYPADRESQARNAGDDRFGGFSNSFSHSSGGGGLGGGGFGGRGFRGGGRG